MFLHLSTIISNRITSIRHAASTNDHIPPPPIMVLRSLIAAAWSKDTADPDLRSEWSPDKPWTGQGDVTALAVEKIIGHSDIVRVQLPGESRPHHFNLLRAEAVGTWGPEAYVDLCRDIAVTMAPGLQVTGVSRIELLDSGEGRNHRIRERYDLLKRKLRAG